MERKKKTVKVGISGVLISNLGPFGWKTQKVTKFPLVTNVVVEQIGMKLLGCGEGVKGVVGCFLKWWVFPQFTPQNDQF